MFEILAGELRATLLGNHSGISHRRGHRRPEHQRRHRQSRTPGSTGAKGVGWTCRGAGGRRWGLAGQRVDAPSRRLTARTARGRVTTHRHTQRPGTTGVEGAGGSGGHGRASRSTTPSRQARVWRSRGRPGPTAPGTPVGPQATQAGRPPHTGTHSGRALRRPERQRHHKNADNQATHSEGARARRPAPP